MEFPKFKLSKRQADLAGRTLIDENASPDEKIDAFEVLENWRSNHIFPVHAYGAQLKTLLNDFGRPVFEHPIVAHRLKRLPSIYGKLKRFPEMKLSRMQDIGGLRIIFPAFDDVYDFDRRLAESNLRVFKRRSDYIKQPKPSGYRSLHLIYEFRDESTPPEYQGILIELQLRDTIQHYWATALETFSVFMGQSLKEGGGPSQTKQFFEVAGACLATVEGSALNEKYADLSPKELALALRDLDRSLGVFQKLDSYRNTIEITRREKREGEYVLLRLNSKRGEVDLQFFSKAELGDAYRAYSEQEQSATLCDDVVLVAVNSLNELFKAYPNYFADTSDFVALTSGFLRDNLPSDS